MENEESRKLFEGEKQGFLSAFNDKGVFMMTYPCRKYVFKLLFLFSGILDQHLTRWSASQLSGSKFSRHQAATAHS